MLAETGRFGKHKYRRQKRTARQQNCGFCPEGCGQASPNSRLPDSKAGAQSDPVQGVRIQGVRCCVGHFVRQGVRRAGVPAPWAEQKKWPMKGIHRVYSVIFPHRSRGGRPVGAGCGHFGCGTEGIDRRGGTPAGDRGRRQCPQHASRFGSALRPRCS